MTDRGWVDPYGRHHAVDSLAKRMTAQGEDFPAEPPPRPTDRIGRPVMSLTEMLRSGQGWQSPPPPKPPTKRKPRLTEQTQRAGQDDRDWLRDTISRVLNEGGHAT